VQPFDGKECPDFKKNGRILLLSSVGNTQQGVTPRVSEKKNRAGKAGEYGKKVTGGDKKSGSQKMTAASGLVN